MNDRYKECKTPHIVQIDALASSVALKAFIVPVV